MQSLERQKRIEEYLSKTEFASLDELSEQVAASVSTVRRDLDFLETKGVLRRTHGGARVVNPKPEEFMFASRDTLQLDEKEAIGRACAKLIQPDQTIILDAGTTVFHVARNLDGRLPQIVTNSLPVANLFSSASKAEVVVSGGVIYPRLGVLVGPLAVEAFSRIRADLAIMSGGGLSLEGISNSHGLLIEIQRAMIQAAQKVIFCLDHTKFGRHSLSTLCDLATIDIVVTDAEAPADLTDALRNEGVEVIIASQDR